MKTARRTCPCHSEAPYSACCERFHLGTALPARPEELMRSRYSGFALGRAPYLLETLAPAHPDRAMDHAKHVRELASIRDVRRFMGLQVFGEWVTGDDGEVLFIAKLFERGQNVGFAEHSRFVRRDGRWLYASGTLVPLRDVPLSMSAKLTREEFLPFADSYAAARAPVASA